MSWPATLVASVTPAGSISSDLTTYITGYGPLGVALVIICLALWKGWRPVSPAMRKADRDESRADLLAEIERLCNDHTEERTRLIAEKQAAEKQRDDALLMVQQQVVPLLVSFTAATQSLLPLLQNVVAMQQRDGSRRDGPAGR